MKLLQSTVTALRAHGFDAYAVEDESAAVTLALSFLREGESVTWGGSETIRKVGLTEAVKQAGLRVYDRDGVPPAERATFMREHYFSDWFFMSANAVTQTGELLNMDGIGNRVASLTFGPKNVLVLVGRNKIVGDVEEGILRVRNLAAPKNAQRFDIKTPCRQTGECADCLCPDTICASLVRTRFCRPLGRIRIILIDRDLGY